MSHVSKDLGVPQVQSLPVTYGVGYEFSAKTNELHI
jgi:hypothetical protein